MMIWIHSDGDVGIVVPDREKENISTHKKTNNIFSIFYHLIPAVVNIQLFTVNKPK